jgi:glyoxylase-like metal-dependent hydrolase (beta-lactamase superfamily II)
MKIPEIIVPGESNGEGMVVYHQTSRGTDVFGMAVPNLHLEAWDLGPTWCYLIRGRNITLIDTGRFGNLEVLRNLLKDTDTDIEDIDQIIITHSHEDHDGNLAEVIHATRAELWAHPIYRQMIAFHPNINDGATHPEMPGSCRLCAMPEKLYKNCRPYHQRRSALKIDKEINDSQSMPQDGLRFIFAPGHSADSICIVLEDEVIFTGDAVFFGGGGVKLRLSFELEFQ